MKIYNYSTNNGNNKDNEIKTEEYQNNITQALEKIEQPKKNPRMT
ncbi:MAG: hypothetical protein ACRD8Z_16860 [Nitrososphaeraceae archaeon]